jgi:hypothetical protein
MIHNVERDEIRFISGRVIITEPLRERQIEEASEEEIAMGERVAPILGDLPSGFAVGYVFDKMDSVFAGDVVVVNLAHVETITRRVVQIEAGPDAFAKD